MKNENYITIQGWMRNVHNLKGNELLLYAIIYGFCQDGESEFTGASKYLEESVGASKSAVRASIKRLEEKGLLSRRIENINGLTLNRYTALKGGTEITPPVLSVCDVCSEIECECVETTRGGALNQHGGGVETTHNNTINNTNKDITNNITNKTMSEIEISDFESEKDLKYFEVAKAFHSLFIKNLKVKKVPTKKLENTNAVKFIAQIRLMYERDDYTDEQFRDVFKFLNSPKGEFWTTNILSTTKLREKFTTLLLQNGRKQASTQDDRSDAEKTESAVRNYYSDLAEGTKEGQRG